MTMIISIREPASQILKIKPLTILMTMILSMSLLMTMSFREPASQILKIMTMPMIMSKIFK